MDELKIFEGDEEMNMLEHFEKLLLDFMNAAPEAAKKSLEELVEAQKAKEKTAHATNEKQS